MYTSYLVRTINTIRLKEMVKSQTNCIVIDCLYTTLEGVTTTQTVYQEVKSRLLKTKYIKLL